MKQHGFQARLNEAKQRGNLSTADLALWFGRPYHTMRGWLVPRTDRVRPGAHEPWGPFREEAYQKLVALERFVQKHRAPSLSPEARRDWLLAHVSHQHRDVSKTHPAA